jgi:hypothetical protein
MEIGTWKLNDKLLKPILLIHRIGFDLQTDKPTVYFPENGYLT